MRNELQIESHRDRIMSRRSLFILLALPTMVVLIAWPVSYYKQYSRRNRTATTAFVSSVDVTSVAVFRGDLHLFFQRSGPDQTSTSKI